MSAPVIDLKLRFRPGFQAEMDKGFQKVQYAFSQQVAKAVDSYVPFDTPISDQRRCKWSAIQSAVRRAAEKAWALNPEGVQQLAGYPLTGAPSAVQFLEMLYNVVVRG